MCGTVEVCRSDSVQKAWKRAYGLLHHDCLYLYENKEACEQGARPFDKVKLDDSAWRIRLNEVKRRIV